VNITALTHLTKLFLKDMAASGSGRIMNVASTAAFQPGPTMAVYYATKAYVMHLSEDIHNEVKDRGVIVTALCPGPTRSGFQSTAGMEESKLVKEKKLPPAHKVAVYGYKAMMKGKSLAIPGTMNALMARSVGFFPRNLVTRMVRNVQEKAQT